MFFLVDPRAPHKTFASLNKQKRPDLQKKCGVTKEKSRSKSNPFSWFEQNNGVDVYEKN